MPVCVHGSVSFSRNPYSPTYIIVLFTGSESQDFEQLISVHMQHISGYSIYYQVHVYV